MNPLNGFSCSCKATNGFYMDAKKLEITSLFFSSFGFVQKIISGIIFLIHQRYQREAELSPLNVLKSFGFWTHPAASHPPRNAVQDGKPWVKVAFCHPWGKAGKYTTGCNCKRHNNMKVHFIRKLYCYHQAKLQSSTWGKNTQVCCQICV